LERDFAEIAFCAVSSSLPISGSGSRLMSLTKRYAQTMKIFHLLTYADKSAMGYFKWQDFSTRIRLEGEMLVHCIKDYQGSTLMHGRIYADARFTYKAGAGAIDQRLRYRAEGEGEGIMELPCLITVDRRVGRGSRFGRTEMLRIEEVQPAQSPAKKILHKTPQNNTTPNKTKQQTSRAVNHGTLQLPVQQENRVEIWYESRPY
jgi:hypothetical protein